MNEGESKKKVWYKGVMPKIEFVDYGGESDFRDVLVYM